jgi:allantoinase
MSALDHDLFAFRKLDDPAPLLLPGGATLGVLLVLMVEAYPLRAPPPFPVPGALDRPYPDVGNWSQRQVGQLEGLWRLLDLIAETGINASFVVQQMALERLGGTVRDLAGAGHAILAGGEHATRLHHDGMTEDEERAIIRGSLDALEEATGRRPQGWRSPHCAQSSRTLRLLAEEGLTHLGDLNNDERPYVISTPAGGLVSLPIPQVTSDLHAMVQHRQDVGEFVSGIRHGAAWLAREAAPGRERLLPVVLHPWIAGVPHRIGAFAGLLRDLTKQPGLAFVTTEAMVDAAGLIRLGLQR